MPVKICDVVMGAGKTSSSINLMNSDRESKYIFITPYLDEVKRIKESCADRDFKDPQNRGDGKLSDLHKLLERKCNIASTHALFKAYNDDTIRLIQEGGYKLILDEVFEVVEQYDIHQDDIGMLLEQKIIDVDSRGRVRWISDCYDGAFSDQLRDVCKSGNLILYKGSMMLWTFPADVFRAFRDVIILTYLFDAQFQKYYFDMNQIETVRIGTVYERGEYHFCDYPNTPEYVRHLKDKIHILEDKKLNEIGDSITSLSSSWYSRARDMRGQPQLRQLRNNLTNVFRNIYNSPSSENLWTTFKSSQDILKGRGYTKGFLSYNVRATNAYRDRTHLAYCVNVFYNPYMKNYFLDHGVDIKEDDFALSEMIQWIWRSAIRDGKDIWVYIPSRRMRELLYGWLEQQARQ